MLSLRIAWRFLRSAPVQSALIAGGIAVGIATQIFVGSLIQSLQGSLIDQTIGSSPQVTISAIDSGKPVAFDKRMQDLVYKDPRLRHDTVVPVRFVTSLFTKGSQSAPLALIGGQLKRLNGIYKIETRLTEGTASLRSNEILIGKQFAEKYALGPGDPMALTLQGGTRATFRVAGVFDLGTAAFNERQAFVNADVPRTLLGWGSSQYSEVQAQLVRPFESAAVADGWRTRLPGVRVVDWQAQNASLLTALQSQSSSSYMIQTFVLVAVALGIASTLAIAAVQKTRQIGILKAMGMADARAGRIFLWQAAILGVGGSTLGVVLAYALIGLFSLAPVPFGITTQAWFVMLSASIGILVALASAVVPIRRTSRLDPIEVIQGA